MLGIQYHAYHARRLAAVVILTSAIAACSSPDEIEPSFAAVYGVVTNASGVPVQGGRVHAITFFEGCSGSASATEDATTDAVGHYRIRFTNLAGGQNPACVQVTAAASSPADSVTVQGPAVQFLPNVDVGNEDSVEVNVSLP